MRDDQRHGRGTLIAKGICVCEGDWCNRVSQFGEWVTTYYPSVSVYLGTAEFLDQVIFLSPQGFVPKENPMTHFCKQLSYGQCHGEGLCLLPNGRTEEGN